MFTRLQVTALSALLAFAGVVNAQTLPLDATFGTAGTSYLSTIPAYYPIDLALQSDKKILCLYSSSGNTYVIRTNEDGSIDNTLMADMSYQLYPTHVPGALQFTGKSCTPNQAIIRSTNDGKIIVAFSGYGIVRLKNSGSVDSAFGNLTYAPGYLDLSYSSPAHMLVNIHDMYDANAAGLYYVGPSGIGTAGSLTDSLIIVKTSRDGVPDPTYGTAGVKAILLDTVKYGFYNEINKIMFTKDGKILVTGKCQRHAFTANLDDIFVAKFNLDGSPDLAFGTGGVTIIDFGHLSQVPNTITCSSVGDIFVSGTHTSATPQYFTTRLSAAGVVDASYGSSGLVLSTPPTCLVSYAGTIAATSYNKLYMAGFYSPASFDYKNEYFSYKADGSLNTGFAPGGSVNMGTYDKATKMLTLPDNKILIMGADNTHPKLMRIAGDAPPALTSHLDIAAPGTWVADGYIHVKVANSAENTEVSLFAIDGKLLKRYGNSDFTGSDVKTAQLPADMPGGVYMLSVHQKSGIENIKFIY